MLVVEAVCSVDLCFASNWVALSYQQRTTDMEISNQSNVSTLVKRFQFVHLIHAQTSETIKAKFRNDCFISNDRVDPQVKVRSDVPHLVDSAKPFLENCVYPSQNDEDKKSELNVALIIRLLNENYCMTRGPYFATSLLRPFQKTMNSCSLETKDSTS